MSEYENKKKQCKNFKCATCHNYGKEVDYCYQKDIADCSKQINTDFSTCEDYLVSEKLVMF